MIALSFAQLMAKRLLVGASTCYESLPMPAAEDLDAHEGKVRFRFPKSYRDSVTSFGVGFLADTFKIAAPGLRKREYDIGAFNRFCRVLVVSEDALTRFSEEDAARARRMIWFSENSVRADYIGWDPQEVTESKQREYRIYIVPHSESVTVAVADSFPEFVLDFCLGTRAMSRFRGCPESEVEVPLQTFSRAVD